MKTRIGPILLDLIQVHEKEGEPLSSRAKLYQKYCALVGGSVPKQTFFRWLSYLGLNVKVSLTIPGMSPNPPAYVESLPPIPEDPKQVLGDPVPDEAGFDNIKEPVIPVDLSNVVIPRDGNSGIAELAAMMGKVKA